MTRFSIRLRTLARRIGITSLSGPLCSLRQNGYEERFQNALFGCVVPGDVVWDVGANVGYYTATLAQLVGPQGSVVAFEPAPACVRALQERFTARPNVTVESLAFGARNGESLLETAVDPLGTTHRLSEPSSNCRDAVRVTVVTADSYRTSTTVTPNVVKLDVEGAEYDVLSGMALLLKDRRLRAVFCEVHFGLLQQRGEPFAPIAIERLLREADFRVRWIDSSHLGATRK